MKQNSGSVVQRVTNTSRKIFSSFVLLFCFSGVIGITMQFLELKWKWLEMTSIILFSISAVWLVISWITPGILIISGRPWLAHAWLRGINKEVIWDTPWEELQRTQKFAIYFWSIFISGSALGALIVFTRIVIREWFP